MLLLSLAFVVAAGTEHSALRAPIEASPGSFFPAPGTTVPRNARFLVFDSTLEVVHVAADGTRTTIAEPVPGALQYVPEARVLDFGALVPGENIVAEATCAACANTIELVWLVDDVLDTTAPAYADTEPVTFVGVDSNSPRQWGVQVCLPVLEVEEPVVHQLDYLSVRDTDIAPTQGPGCLIDPGEQEIAGTEFYVVVPAEDDVDELCFIASVFDVAGLADVLPETCVPLESTEQFTAGCSQAPAATTALFALVLVAARRRRVRPSCGA